MLLAIIDAAVKFVPSVAIAIVGVPEIASLVVAVITKVVLALTDWLGL